MNDNLLKQVEDKCSRCAECCRIKFVTWGGKTVVSDIYCPGLDLETKLCMIYEHRLNNEYGIPCTTIPMLMARGLLPNTCVYAERGYQGMQVNRLHLAALYDMPEYQETKRTTEIAREAIARQERRKREQG